MKQDFHTTSVEGTMSYFCLCKSDESEQHQLVGLLCGCYATWVTNHGVGLGSVGFKTHAADCNRALFNCMLEPLGGTFSYA